MTAPSRAAPPLLEVQDLRKHFAVRKGLFGRHVEIVKAVDGVSFRVGVGETLGLVGESGCGKTTCGRALLRLTEPTAGRALYWPAPDASPVAWFELPPGELRRRRRDLQIIFQDPFSSLNPRMTAGDIVGESLRVHRLARGAELEGRVAELLVRVGLTADARNRFPHEFSGGQRQRIGVARALAMEPRFIVCDEAVSALDISIQAQVINLLRDLQAEFQLSYLFIAHDLSLMKYLADRIAVMYLGRLVEEGDAEEVFGGALHPYTQALLAAVPRPVPTKRRVFAPLTGEVPSPLDPPLGCHFASRCPVAERRCRERYPEMVEVSETRRVACHLVGR